MSAKINPVGVLSNGSVTGDGPWLVKLRFTMASDEDVQAAKKRLGSKFDTGKVGWFVLWTLIARGGFIERAERLSGVTLDVQRYSVRADDGPWKHGTT